MKRDGDGARQQHREREAPPQRKRERRRRHQRRARPTGSCPRGTASGLPTRRRRNRRPPRWRRAAGPPHGGQRGRHASAWTAARLRLHPASSAVVRRIRSMRRSSVTDSRPNVCTVRSDRHASAGARRQDRLGRCPLNHHGADRVRDRVMQLARQARALLGDGQAGRRPRADAPAARRAPRAPRPPCRSRRANCPAIHGPASSDGGHGDLALAARRPRLGERRAGQRDQPARDPPSPSARTPRPSTPRSAARGVQRRTSAPSRRRADGPAAPPRARPPRPRAAAAGAARAARCRPPRRRARRTTRRRARPRARRARAARAPARRRRAGCGRECDERSQRPAYAPRGAPHRP